MARTYTRKYLQVKLLAGVERPIGREDVYLVSAEVIGKEKAMVGSEVDSVQIGMGLPYGVDAAALECYRTCRTQRSVFLNTVLVDVATEVIARISPLTVRTHNDVAWRVAWIQLRVDKRKCAVALVEAQGIGGRSVVVTVYGEGNPSISGATIFYGNDYHEMAIVGHEASGIVPEGYDTARISVVVSA